MRYYSRLFPALLFYWFCHCCPVDQNSVFCNQPATNIRSNLARANEKRDWRVDADFAQVLIGIVRPMYANDELEADLDATVYALDSTTVDLCLSLFPRAKFRQRKVP